MALLRKPTALGTIPGKSASPLEEGPRKGGGSESRKKSARILIVDDDVQLAKGLARIIRQMNHKAETADARDALMLCRSERFDLVISDLDMPYISGTELTRRILAADPGARVIIHTANETITDGELMAQGAIGVLRKPADIKTIKETVEKSLKR